MTALAETVRSLKDAYLLRVNSFYSCDIIFERLLEPEFMRYWLVLCGHVAVGGVGLCSDRTRARSLTS